MEIGGVTLIGVVSLILYFTVGGFFGMFSDSLRTVGVRLALVIQSNRPALVATLMLRFSV